MSTEDRINAREAMPATEPRDAEQAGVVEAAERIVRFEDMLQHLTFEDTVRRIYGPPRLEGALREDLLILAALAASPPPQPTPEAHEAGDGWLERLEALAKAAVECAPGVWRTCQDATHAGDRRITSSQRKHIGKVYASESTDLDGFARRLSEFIAAANPATVLDLITRARAADAAEAGWQPIESAPTGGADILVGLWAVRDSKPAARAWSSWTITPKPGWMPYGCDGEMGEEPTHWMPVPTPPALLTGSKQ